MQAVRAAGAATFAYILAAALLLDAATCFRVAPREPEPEGEWWPADDTLCTGSCDEGVADEEMRRDRRELSSRRRRVSSRRRSSRSRGGGGATIGFHSWPFLRLLKGLCPARLVCLPCLQKAPLPAAPADLHRKRYRRWRPRGCASPLLHAASRGHAACVQQAGSAASIMQSISAQFVTPKQ